MTSSARDGAEEFYAQLLWSLVPAIYRTEDSETRNTIGPLQALMSQIGASIAEVRRSIDRLWANQSIEDADEWALPLLAALIGADDPTWFDARGRLASIAHTIHHRRRRGTVTTLQAAVRDITGWETLVMEGAPTLARTRHDLDGPLRAGYADLRDPRSSRRAGGPFDAMPHTVDARLPGWGAGQYRADAMQIWMWRLHTLQMSNSTPVASTGDPSQFTFDPTGRDVPLFLPTPIGAAARTPQRTVAQVPGPLPDELAWTSGRAPDIASNTWSIANPTGSPPLNVYVEPPHVYVEPQRGRFNLAAADPRPLAVGYWYGAAGLVGAGPYPRPAATDVTPSLVATDAAELVNQLNQAWFEPTVLAVRTSATAVLGPATTRVEDRLVVRAEPGERPVLDLYDHAAKQRGTWTIVSTNSRGQLVLDGLHVFGGDIVLDGDFLQVCIRCCTLDPGTSAGDDGAAIAIDGRRLFATHLRLAPKATVRQLVLQQSIAGPVLALEGSWVTQCEIRDCIVQHDSGSRPSEVAITLPGTTLTLDGSTVLGRSECERLQAETTILHDRTDVADVDHAMATYVAYPDEASGQPALSGNGNGHIRIPRRATLFTTTRFGSPGYAQLIDEHALPPHLRRVATGAGDGAELGAFHAERTSLKRRAALTALDSYLPLGLRPSLRYVT